ncbi:helix-turn-helix domain-containing protein [Dactylosporangium sp. McL0621]|uniref:helix-turn-helix domain-containing protein n=1 Tax=Dactylosporangium sp. McL0621 TaxID=3415678 RepID=UPI003CECC880
MATERTGTTLTPQDLQIARLAGRGLSNKDIAAQLFLSSKTIAYHLNKAYPKPNSAAVGSWPRSICKVPRRIRRDADPPRPSAPACPLRDADRA